MVTRRTPEAGPPGARRISTPALQLARLVITDTADHHAVGVIHGLAGLGKTFAMRTCTTALAARTRPAERIEVATIAFPSRPTMRLLANLLLQTLTGAPPARQANRFYLTAALVRELARVPRLVVVDEAQRLPEECIELLRYLHDHDDTSFGLLYVGGNGCWEVLSRQPMLRSRVWRRQTFAPMSRAEVPQVMRSYHRLYAGVDDELLHYVDDKFAHGIWRNWALFSSTAHLIAKRARRTRLDAEIVDNAFALHPGAGDAN
ncbi:AAA family ATPase [Micromonospora maritima]|uniref:AAA family ATPase n=1 Tax=Micromonospora maritima TaxID=986711 RepID=UPI0037984D95